MSNDVIELNDETFEEEVEKVDGLVFVDFWAPWCAPCRFVAPTVEKLAQRYNCTVKFVKVNVDESPATAEQYQIGSIPTLALFRDGEVVAGVAGAAPEEYLAEMIEKQLSGVSDHEAA